MKSQYIEDIVDGTEVDSDFAVITQTSPKKYKNKDGLWFSLEVTDKTGKIHVKYWGGTNEETVKTLFSSFTIGDIITIKAKAQFDSYAGAIIISINEDGKSNIQKSDTFDSEDFLPVTKKNISEMVSKLQEAIEGIENQDIKRLTKSFFDDTSFIEKFSKMPAAMKYHHNYVGGLIEHVLNMIDLAKVTSSQYEGELDLDLMVVGCIFHDIGKMSALEMKNTITYSTTGDLLGHISIGSQMVQSKIDSLGEFPEVLKNKIIHLILSHHGTFEFGSPVEPMFPEAVALNRIDECNSKIKRAIQLKEESVSNTDDEIIYIRNFGKMYLK